MKESAKIALIIIVTCCSSYFFNMPTPDCYFVSFRSFHQQFFFSGIRTWIVGVEGEHTYNLTTKTAVIYQLNKRYTQLHFSYKPVCMVSKLHFSNFLKPKLTNAIFGQWSWLSY